MRGERITDLEWRVEGTGWPRCSLGSSN